MEYNISVLLQPVFCINIQYSCRKSQFSRAFSVPNMRTGFLLLLGHYVMVGTYVFSHLFFSVCVFVCVCFCVCLHVYVYLCLFVFVCVCLCSVFVSLLDLIMIFQRDKTNILGLQANGWILGNWRKRTICVSPQQSDQTY